MTTLSSLLVDKVSLLIHILKFLWSGHALNDVFKFIAVPLSRKGNFGKFRVLVRRRLGWRSVKARNVETQSLLSN